MPMSDAPHDPSSIDSLSSVDLDYLNDILARLDLPQVTTATTLPPDDDTRKRRRAPPRNAANREAYDQLMGAARFIPRGGDAYWNLARIVLYGCTELFGHLPNHRPMPGSEHHVAIFKLIIATTSFDLKPVLRHLYLNSHGTTKRPWKDLVAAMGAAATSARTTDTNKLKSATNIFLPAPDCTFKPAVDITSKSGRGLTHPQLRILLMPWADRNLFPPLEFGNRPVILDKIASKTYSPSNGKFPSFFYPEGGWVADDYQENLFRTDAFPRALRLIFLGPSNVLNRPGEAATKFEKGCNAAIHNTWTVTANMVAYIAVQLRISISDVSQWTEKDGKYSYKKLYQKVLDAFKDNTAPGRETWGEETLQWLTDRTFGDLQHAEHRPGANEDDEDSEDEAISQRRRRDEASRRLPQTSENSCLTLLMLSRTVSFRAFLDWNPRISSTTLSFARIETLLSPLIIVTALALSSRLFDNACKSSKSLQKVLGIYDKPAPLQALKAGTTPRKHSRPLHGAITLRARCKSRKPLRVIESLAESCITLVQPCQRDSSVASVVEYLRRVVAYFGAYKLLPSGYRVGEDNSELWSELFVLSHVEMLEFWLGHGAEHPLSLYLHYRQPMAGMGMLSLLAASAGRWRDVDLFLHPTTLDTLASEYGSGQERGLPRQLPHLRRLSLGLVVPAADANPTPITLTPDRAKYTSV
ncbi:hypothetical protein C8F01DRAFT_1083738 [Mycena amicta]|nr:hypothetical protein C8F01DRAFT_1083738 [Mycena amicta]